MTTPSSKNKIYNLDNQRKHFFSHESLSGFNAEKGIEYLSSLDEKKFSSIVLNRNKGLSLIQPRGGFPTFDKQLLLSQSLADGGADFIPLTVDSYTRLNDYDRAEILLQESEDLGKDLLNGYPLIAHGYEITRNIYKEIDLPVSLRHGTPDARLLVENALASGITEIEGGALCYSLPYASKFPIDRALLYWQYVDRICAEYSDNQRKIHRESFGPLTATLVPPVIVALVQILELLLAAEQGVTSFSVSFSQSGSIEQDIALAKILRKQSSKYLQMFGFDNVDVYLVFHQWMGAFPHDKERAEKLIGDSAIISAMIKADKIVVKTKDEAFGVPTIESNVLAVQQVKNIFNNLSKIDIPDNPRIQQEIELISQELDEILNFIFSMSGQSFTSSIYHSVKLGCIDIPFSPHSQNANKLLSIRDKNNSIRIKDPGLLPITMSSINKEKELLETDYIHESNIIDKITNDILIMA
jgi:methylaspartate mutase epsilon subunit